MKIFKFCIFAFFSFPIVVLSQQVDFDAPAFYIPQREPLFSRGFGFGARAMGMGGAFIAVGDDSTAASWNPAGLARMMSLEFGFVGRNWKANATEAPSLIEVSGNTEIDHTSSSISNYSDSSNATSIDLLSFAMPVNIGGEKRFSIQASYQRNFVFPGKREISYDIAWYTHGRDNYKNIRTDIDDTQRGGLDSLTFSIATTLMKKFHIGLSFNYWNGKEEREINLKQEGILSFGEADLNFTRNLSISYDGTYKGNSINFGILYEISDNFSFGLVYKPSFKLKFDRKNEKFTDEGKAGDYNIKSVTGLTDLNDFFKDGDIKWPGQIGLGIAFHPTPKWTFAFDVGSIFWSKSDFEGKPFPINYSFSMNIPYYGVVEKEAKDSLTYRFGFEKLIGTQKSIYALRGGFFYEKNLMVSDFYSQPSSIGFSLGGGILYKNLLVDAAFVYDMMSVEYKDGEATFLHYGYEPNRANFNWEGKQKSNNVQFLLSAFYRF